MSTMSMGSSEDKGATSKPPAGQTWRATLSTAGFVSLLAGALPFATFIHGAFQKSRDIALEQAKQMESARVAYLDRMKDEESRARILRFIVATSQDSSMRTWAAAEVKLVKDSQESLLTEIKDVVTQARESKDPATRKAAQEKVNELEVRLGKPSGVPTIRIGATPMDATQSTASQPPTSDSPLPTTPPNYVGGLVPNVASSCVKWQPPNDLTPNQCKIVCWEAIQKTRYNVNETVSSASAEDCEKAALKRCQKAQNNFCAFAWATPS